MAMQDHFDEQTWKAHPGMLNTAAWLVQNVESDDYESLWHLLIPPIMTLLDDYEAPYKLHGIRVVSKMLERVPSDLLRRTGVDGLLRQSLIMAMTNLNNPETPSLIRAAVPALLSLVLLTTTPGSTEQFDQLCAIIGEGIIGSVWTYSPHDMDAVEASVDVLSPILKSLGIGCSRYLKVLIPQLLHPLSSTALHPPPISLQISSVQALCITIEVCAPRIHCWKGAIIESLGKCWVILADSARADTDSISLKSELSQACVKLAKACPTVIEGEYSQLVKVDAHMFQELVRHKGLEAEL